MQRKQYGIRLNPEASLALERAADRLRKPATTLATELLEEVLARPSFGQQEEGFEAGLVGTRTPESSPALSPSVVHEMLWRQIYLTSCQVTEGGSREVHRKLREQAKAHSRKILESAGFGNGEGVVGDVGTEEREGR